MKSRRIDELYFLRAEYLESEKCLRSPLKPVPEHVRFSLVLRRSRDKPLIDKNLVKTLYRLAWFVLALTVAAMCGIGLVLVHAVVVWLANGSLM